MSETAYSLGQNLGYEAASIPEIQDQTNVSGGFGSEIIDDNWDAELFALVAANADVLVRCSWLNDMEVTLSDAMNAYPEPITYENIHLVSLAVSQLLANRVTETEEPDEGDKQEEDELEKNEEVDQRSNTKIETQKVQGDLNTVDSKRQPKKEIDRAKHIELSASRAEKSSGSEGSNPGAPEELVVATSTSESSVLESGIDDTGQEFKPMGPSAEGQLKETKFAIKSKVEAKQQMPTFEILEVNAAANPIVEEVPAPDRPQLVADQETEPFTLSVAIEATSEPEPTGLSPLDPESAATSDDTTELSDEKIEVAEYEPTLATLDYQTGTKSFTNFVEEEVLLDHLEEVDLELDELYMSSMPTLEVAEYDLEAGEETSISQLSNESDLSGQLEVTSPEQLAQISLTIEEIEDSLIQLTGRIKASEQEATEKVNEILDKIIEVPAKLEASSGENIITEAEAQEELEVLFTELLDKMAIDYTPELIESLSYLTLKWHLADEMQKLKNEEETDKAPQDSGTHEIIKKLLVGLSIIKKAFAHASAIGKSAIQLYIFHFAA